MSGIEFGRNPSHEDAELDNFLSRVDDITKIMEGLVSTNETDQERAIRQADIFLHKGGGEGSVKGDEEPEVKVTSDRTVINPSPPGGEGDVGRDAFMKMMEGDAAARAKDRKEQKKKSDEFRAKGNNAFNKENYAEALANYNKAVNLIKDSPCLYTNRALTYIRIGVPTKALEDLNFAIELNPKSVKGRLLKARALLNLSEPSLCHEWLEDTKKLFPQQISMIKRYEEDLFELRMELNMAYNGEKDKKNKDEDDLKSRLHQVADGETIWLKAARGDLGHGKTDRAT